MTESPWWIKSQLRRTSPFPEVITVNKNKEIPSGFFIFLIHRMSVLGLRTPATYSGFWRRFKKWWTCIQVALQPQESRHSATHWSIWQTRRNCQTWEKDWFPLSHVLWVSYQIVYILPLYVKFNIVLRRVNLLVGDTEISITSWAGSQMRR